PRARARDPGRLQRMREPGPVVVALRRDEDLSLVLEAAERLRVDDAVAVALERRAQGRIGLGPDAPGRVGARRERREPGVLPCLGALMEVLGCDGDGGHGSILPGGQAETSPRACGLPV